MQRLRVSVVSGVGPACRMLGAGLLVLLLTSGHPCEAGLTGQYKRLDDQRSAPHLVSADDYREPAYIRRELQDSPDAAPASEGASSGGKGSNPKTTFLVPRSDKIQIAFTDGGREIQQSLHTDLLKLYKSVMEQLLERDQFIQTMKTLMDKMALLDNLAERVRRLELRVNRGHVVVVDGDEGGGADNSVVHGGGDGSRRNQEDRLDNVAKKVRRHQEDLAKIQEDHDRFSKLLADQALENQRHRDFTGKLQQTVGKMELEISRNKQMTIAQAELLDHHANKMETQRSTSEVIDAKVGTLSSKVQWHDFRLGMMENVTSRLDSDYISMQLSLGEFHTTQRKIYGLVEKLQTDTERCHVNVATAKMKVRFLEQDVDKLLTIVEKLTPANVSSQASRGMGSGGRGGTTLPQPYHNSTLAGSARIQVQEMIDRSVAPLNQAIGHLNLTTDQLGRDNDRQQKQIDAASMDIETLRTDGRDFSRQLRDVRDGVSDVSAELEDWGAEKDRIKRKLNKLEKEVKEHRHDRSAGRTPLPPRPVTEPNPRAPTTVGHLRRTTRSLDDVTPAGREDKVTPVGPTEAVVTASARPKSLTTESVIKVTTKPFTENDSDKGTTHHGRHRPGAETSPSQLPDTPKVPKGANCTVTGFGPPRLVRTFERIFTGTWMKDPTRPDDRRIYVLRNNVKVSNVREYANETMLAENVATVVHHMPHKCTGTGHVVYDGHVYCNKYQSNRIVKYNLQTERVRSERLRNAGHDNTFPYSSGAYTDIDLAIDEQGLWAIYSTRADDGRMVVTKLNTDDLTMERTWLTAFNKTEAANAFMVCGRLYTTVYRRGHPIQVGYIFDTHTGREVSVTSGQIAFSDKNPDMQTSLDYNPTDRRLYAWNLSQDWDGLLVSYDVHFSS